MPNALAEARKNLDNPPRIYTEIAIEQIDGNHAFFWSRMFPAAFTEVKDAALLAEFRSASDAVISALTDSRELAAERFAEPVQQSYSRCGEDTYRKVLDADEMITTPLPYLWRGR